MDAEVGYATQYGIDYWAFCTYPIGCKDYSPPASDCPYIQCCADNYALSYALERYLSKPRPVKFSLILQFNWFPGCDHGGNETLEQEVARYVGYFQRPDYQRVSAGRPLVYLFGGDATHNGPALARLRSAALAAGLPSPYYVYFGGDAASAARSAASLSAQAISRYATTLGSSVSPFSASVRDEQAFWAAAAGLGVDMVPPVTAGWDPRPRFDYPVPWGPPTPQCGPVGQEKCYTIDPTMDELTNFTASAINFTLSHPTIAPAQTVLVSAWNEHDEGHWVAPSLQDGPQKLVAIKKAIDSFHD
jgi:hypothetical protein